MPPLGQLESLWAHEAASEICDRNSMHMKFDGMSAERKYYIFRSSNKSTYSGRLNTQLGEIQAKADVLVEDAMLRATSMLLTRNKFTKIRLLSW